MASYGMSVTVPGTLDEVKAAVVTALKAEGFGILTEIDVQSTLQQKIGAEIEPYLILGVCNPRFAHRALTIDRAIGLLLPCNVVLREVDGQVEVSTVDPDVMFSVIDPALQHEFATLPDEVKQGLRNALQALATARI